MAPLKKKTAKSTSAIKISPEIPSLTFTALSEERTRRFLSAEDVDELEKLFLEQWKEGGVSRDGVAEKEWPSIECSISGLWWCRQQGFNPERTSVFYAILRTLFSDMTEKRVGLAECAVSLKKLLCERTAPGDERKVDQFDAKQAKLVSNYVHKTLFQHQKLYESFFDLEQPLVNDAAEVYVEVPLEFWPPPLTEAVSQSVYDASQAAPELSSASDPSSTEAAAAAAAAAVAAAEAGEVALRLEEKLMCSLTADQIRCAIEEVFQEEWAKVQDEVVKKIATLQSIIKV